jgi:hypothetical protein
MNKITSQAVRAFSEKRTFKLANTQVDVLPNVTILKLHGNEIAYLYNDPESTLSITNCGWFSRTTKERLNAIDGVRINQSKGVWYLNGEKWDGKLTNVKR